MIKNQYENNWVNCVIKLRLEIISMSEFQWKKFVNDRIRKYAFDCLTVHCKNNGKL